ncbi:MULTISPECIES: ABC transporter substrate-binding protein [Nesterenkonia]|uniref:Putative ABC transport system substrate-binding protein n=2 Tax=Nesterenkonia TaxID=57494 RepID=A0A839FSS7_9MICC|nr:MULTISPECIES: ABC transporter substrate-binding protein [Nesterenkonia]MBA8921631.1 putative ABC transport system substrate-binding protein [Nesterenkonia jeotgali]NYJ16811.1 putative ABC transport system substrate-binding protein [Nesterenkonia sandarakina]
MRSRSTTMRLSAALAATALMLTACGGETQGEDTEGEAGEEGGSYSIGITQIVSHPSLDEARDGFKAAFEDAGVEVEWDEQNAQGEQATASNIAGTFATSDLDLVHAIATPTAQAAAQAVTDKPIVFSAVTDPEEAGLVDSWEEPGGNITGASDLNPVMEQFELLQEIAPDAETVGIVYSSGETNSAVQVELAQEAADELGLEIQEATISNSSEVQQGVESLDVDAIWVPTDNAVVSALESVLQYGQQNSIPVIASEGDSVIRGSVATYGINYGDLGRQAGEMALRILQDGEDPASMAVETQETLELIVNPEAAEAMGVELDQELLDRADTVVGEDVEAEDPAEADEAEGDEDAEEEEE